MSCSVQASIMKQVNHESTNTDGPGNCNGYVIYEFWVNAESFRGKVTCQPLYLHIVKFKISIGLPVADPGFPQEGAPTLRGGGGGASIRFCQIFPQTAWNWKNLDPHGGHVSLTPSLRSTTVYECYFCAVWCAVFFSVGDNTSNTPSSVVAPPEYSTPCWMKHGYQHVCGVVCIKTGPLKTCTTGISFHLQFFWYRCIYLGVLDNLWNFISVW